MLHHGKIYFEIKAIQLEFERLLQKKYAGKGNSLAKVLPWPAQGRSCSGLDFGRRMGRLVDRMQPWLLAQQKTPQLLLRGLKKKGQALLIAVSGVCAIATVVVTSGRTMIRRRRRGAMTAVAGAQKSGRADEAAYEAQKMTSLHSETPLPMQKVLPKCAVKPSPSGRGYKAPTNLCLHNI